MKAGRLRAMVAEWHVLQISSCVALNLGSSRHELLTSSFCFPCGQAAAWLALLRLGGCIARHQHRVCRQRVRACGCHCSAVFCVLLRVPHPHLCQSVGFVTPEHRAKHTCIIADQTTRTVWGSCSHWCSHNTKQQTQNTRQPGKQEPAWPTCSRHAKDHQHQRNQPQCRRAHDRHCLLCVV